MSYIPFIVFAFDISHVSKPSIYSILSNLVKQYSKFVIDETFQLETLTIFIFDMSLPLLVILNTCLNKFSKLSKLEQSILDKSNVEEFELFILLLISSTKSPITLGLKYSFLDVFLILSFLVF